MKRLHLFLMALCLNVLNIQAQDTAGYEEHLERVDSVVMFDYRGKRKCVFHNIEDYQVEQVYYYRWDGGRWFWTNMREYQYDQQGNDTLRVIFSLKEGKWRQVEELRYTTYGEHGGKLQERTMSYKDGKKSSQSRWEYQYNEKGKQASAAQYKEKQGVWQQTMAVQEEYDAEGNPIREVREYLNTNSPEKYCTVMRYDKKGRLITQVDSVYSAYDGQRGREWRRRDYSYNDQGLDMVKETLTTIDHDAVQQTMEESVFDPQGNLVQTRFYRQDHGVWRHVRSISNVYDLNRDASSIMNRDILFDVLAIETKEQFRHKLLKQFRVEIDEDGDEETFETCYYYSVHLPMQ